MISIVKFDFFYKLYIYIVISIIVALAFLGMLYITRTRATKEADMESRKIFRITSVISSIICLVGGILVIITAVEERVGYFGIGTITVGIFIIIGALSGLKFQRSGFLLCLSMGVIAVLPRICDEVWEWSVTAPCIMVFMTYQLGVAFSIGGGIVGLIGGILKSREGSAKTYQVSPQRPIVGDIEMTKIAIISSIICLVGGILVITTFSEAGIYGLAGTILFGFIIIIGALSGLKFQRVGPLLCLSMGIIAPLTSLLGACFIRTWEFTIPSFTPCIMVSLTYQLGVAFSIGGGIVGLIGGILKSR
ncbi:MAG: hypothetical protein ACFFCI_19790, partial [Promethearchaeota archaeon]